MQARAAAYVTAGVRIVYDRRCGHPRRRVYRAGVLLVRADADEALADLERAGYQLPHPPRQT